MEEVLYFIYGRSSLFYLWKKFFILFMEDVFIYGRCFYFREEVFIYQEFSYLSKIIYQKLFLSRIIYQEFSYLSRILVIYQEFSYLSRISYFNQELVISRI
jgi:hypothetical protein